MTRQPTKKKKPSKAARRRRQRRLCGIMFGVIIVLGVGCMLTLSHLGRARQEWMVQGAGIEIAAPPAVGPMTMEGRADDGDALTALPVVVTEAPSPVPTPTPSPSPTPEPTSRTLTITAAGDCTLGGSVHQDTYMRFKKAVQTCGYDYFFSNVRSLFESDDLTILNLEGPLTDTGKARHGSYVFKGNPDYVRILTGSSVELCNVANNHSEDFGAEGLNRTVEVLSQAGVGYCGYDWVYRATINGIRVSALGYLEWTIKRDRIVEAVKAERPKCDILIVNMHWGREKHYEPMSVQKRYGHAIIDAGADLIIGTHPHVYGGVEKYNGKYIAYSLGNFCFGGNSNPTDKRCLIFRQTFSVSPAGTVSDAGIDIIPCSVSSVANTNDYRPTVMQAAEGEKLLQAVARYSSLPEDDTLWLTDSYPVQSGLQTANVAAGGALS